MLVDLYLPSHANFCQTLTNQLGFQAVGVGNGGALELAIAGIVKDLDAHIVHRLHTTQVHCGLNVILALLVLNVITHLGGLVSMSRAG
jgi:hypothetical protein